MAINTEPFLNPWDICSELSKVLEEINKEFPNVAGDKPNTYKHSPQYKIASEFYRKICPNCCHKLPEVHKAILKGQKIIQGGGCCGSKDMCELLYWIQALRPATKGKVLDGGWRKNVLKKVNHKLCCIINVIEQEEIRDINTFPHIKEMPNFNISHLPGFNYPTYRLPPIVNLIRTNGQSEGLSQRGNSASKLENASKSGGGKGKVVKMNHNFNPLLEISYNYSGISKVFGEYNEMFNRFGSSPLKFIYDFICNNKGISLPGLQASLSVVMPNLAIGGHINLKVDPCINKYLPPIAKSVNVQASLTLGDGKEWGIYSNYKLDDSNFGSGFTKGEDFDIPPLVKTEDETFIEVEVEAQPRKHGFKADIDSVNWPNFGKGVEYS